MPTQHLHHTDATQIDEFSTQNSSDQPSTLRASSPYQPATSQAVMHQLHTAPPHIRRQLVSSLQRQNGNQFVQRLVADYQKQDIQRHGDGCAACGGQHVEDEEQVQVQRAPNLRRAPYIQRYTVPGSLSCMGTVSYMNQSSPYRPNWAKTSPHYTFVGATTDSNERLDDGSYIYTMQGRSSNSITHTAPQDLPNWNPTARPNREAEVAAWNTMHGTLQAHENEHVRIAEENRVAMETDWQNVNIEGTGASLAAARTDAARQLREDKALWLAQSQAQQDMIDPFSVELVCPAPPAEDEEGASAESTSAEPITVGGQAHGEHATAAHS